MLRPGYLWKHRVSGLTYEIVTTSIQCTNGDDEGRHEVIYRLHSDKPESTANLSRCYDEFVDRFIPEVLW